MGKIIVYPKVEKLQEEVFELTERMATLVAVRDRLIGHETRKLEADYMTKIGMYEVELYKVQLETLKLRRILELARQFDNRDEELDFDIINMTVEEELAEYEERLAAKKEQLDQTLNWVLTASPLSSEESFELRAIYLQIVKKLHPDINPKLTASQKELFNKAVEAYKNGDLLSLQVIEAVLKNDESLEEEASSSIEDLYAQRKKLKKMCETIEKSIEEIEKNFPFTEKDFLKDSVAVKKRREEIQNSIERFEESIVELKKDIKEIKERYHD